MHGEVFNLVFNTLVMVKRSCRSVGRGAKRQAFLEQVEPTPPQPGSSDPTPLVQPAIGSGNIKTGRKPHKKKKIIIPAHKCQEGNTEVGRRVGGGKERGRDQPQSGGTVGKGERIPVPSSAGSEGRWSSTSQGNEHRNPEHLQALNSDQHLLWAGLGTPHNPLYQPLFLP